MSGSSYEETYTHPRMREEIKEEIKASGKGAAPGQWSARKSQMLKQEYERRGGYRGGKQQGQKALTEWSQEQWQTKEGEAEARKAGETKRYLPKEAWERMSEQDKREAEESKRAESKKGKQYVSNPKSARQARRRSHAPPIEGYDELKAEDILWRVKNLSGEEARRTLDYEKRHKNRKTVVEKLEREI